MSGVEFEAKGSQVPPLWAASPGSIRATPRIDPSTPPGDDLGRLSATGQWMHREGYRVKAPEAERADAVRRLAQREEQDFKDFKRERARSVVGRGTWGEDAGRAPSFQQGREALLAACQKKAQEQSKIMQRLRRKEEEERARAEEKKKADDERRQREADFYRREQAKKERMKQDEAKKKEHWQTWTPLQLVTPGAAGSSNDPVVLHHAAAEGDWACSSCTLMNQASRSCCEACDSVRPTDPSWQCTRCTLLNAPREMFCMACSAPAPSATPPALQATRPPSRLSAWLKEHRLEEYEQRLVAAGYDEMEDLEAMQLPDLDELFQLLGVLPAHKNRFKRGLNLVPEAPNIERHQPVCPVCLLQVPSDESIYSLSCGHVYCHTHALDAWGRGACAVCRAAPEGPPQQLFF